MRLSPAAVVLVMVNYGPQHSCINLSNNSYASPASARIENLYNSILFMFKI